MKLMVNGLGGTLLMFSKGTHTYRKKSKSYCFKRIKNTPPKQSNIFKKQFDFLNFIVFFVILDSFGVFWAVFLVLGAPGASGGGFWPQKLPSKGGFLIRLQH